MSVRVFVNVALGSSFMFQLAVICKLDDYFVDAVAKEYHCGEQHLQKHDVLLF